MEWLVEAPGRVNLIGEHIDYLGLSVLPMAIPRRIRLRVRPRADAVVRIEPADATWSPREFTLTFPIAPFPPGDWGNYAKAAANELVSDMALARGFDATLESDLPVAAGLSSSSALVVAVGLALLQANDRSLPALELAERMARAEQYVGTHGGGMDQAICLLAREGHAARIDFQPLRAEPIAIPADWHFVVASSAVLAEKSGAARDAYNERTRQCGEALDRLTAALGSSAATYRELLASHPLDTLLEQARDRLPVLLYARFRHVVTEAYRVFAAENALRAGDAAAFGALMCASHDSLRDDYQVSTPELDAMVEIACRAGAAGARLTGAGFGGCILALAVPENSGAICRALERDYFTARPADRMADALFVVRPAAGAAIRSAPAIA
jgi:galactokinase